MIAFLEILSIPHFRFGSMAQKESGISKKIIFLINSKDFCQTSICDTILILET